MILVQLSKNGENNRSVSRITGRDDSDNTAPSFTLGSMLPQASPGKGGYPLPRLPFLRLRFTLRAVEHARLPLFKGSLLRGAFGHALRRTVCSMGPSQPCPDCLLRRTCVHTRLFETLIEGEPPPFLRGLPTSPRPYVFEPGTDARDFAPGDPFPFDLLLFGQAADLQAYALLAVERMAKAGLGADRSPFVLYRAEASIAGDGWQEVYSEGRASPALGALPPLLPSEEPLGEGRAVLRFLTPTRLQVRGQLLSEPDFRTLVFFMLRRTLELSWFHLPGAEIDWSFRPLLDLTTGARVAAADLRWRSWERYSNRQGRKIEMGGFIGDVELEGDLAPFAPLLRSAEVLHVGKGATFGLGRVLVSNG